MNRRSTPPRRWSCGGASRCTVNRVGDRYLDQVARSGHAAGIDDLDRIAALGIRTLRYPVLWEWAAPDGPADLDWAWADERLRPAARAGHPPHRRPGPSRQRPALHEPARRRLRRRAWPTTPAGVAERYPWVDALHAGQRAADHGPLQRAVRPLVSARPRRP